MIELVCILAVMIALVVLTYMPEDIMFILGLSAIAIGLFAFSMYFMAVAADEIRKDGKDRGWW